MEVDLTIGIITWKARDLLRQLLQSISSNLGPVSHEIIVIDNNSLDGTVEMVERDFPEIRLIKNPQNVGVAPARNSILKLSRGRYVLFLDVDTKILSGAIPILVKTMDEHPQAAIGGPKLVYGDGRLQLSCRPFPSLFNIIIEGTFLRDWFPNSRWVKEYTMEDWDHSSLREVDWMYGACLIIRKEALKTIGYFDEKFFYLYEDVDLCYRCKKRGFKVLYIPEAQVIHFLERERKGLFHPKILSHLKSIFRYLLKDRYGLIP